MYCALVGIVALALAGCASTTRPWLNPYRPTVSVRGLTYCAKHSIPTISVRGYHSIRTRDRLVLVHDWDPRSLRCGEDSPNRLPDDSSFNQSSLRPVRGLITFCAPCAQDYWHCRGGGRSLLDADIQKITSLAMQDPTFRRPLVRIFAVYSPNAVAIGGRQERVGDVFTNVGLEKSNGRWRVAYPVSSHRVVAVGRSDP
jgi:hypothetical protein